MVLRGVCLVACLAAAFGARADEPKEPKLKGATVFAGTHSQIRNERIELVTTKKEWDQLWDQHYGTTKERRLLAESLELSVDFDTHSVVAVFVPGCYWCAVTTRERDGMAVIGYEKTYIQTEGREPDAVTKQMKRERKLEKERTDALAPYAFVVIPKPVRTVVIERGQRRDLSTPPEWKEVKRFPVSDKK
jgi:hypothetical protein